MAFLAEIPESAATDRTREIYAAMRALGAPMVALIFRHLASLPGGIEWAWDAMGPAWRDGLLQEAAWRIARAAPIAPLPPIPAAALAELGVDAAALHEIHVVVRSYNIANPMNLLSITCLTRLLGGGTATRGFAPRTWRAPPSPGNMVAMIDLGATSPEVGDILRRLAAEAPQDGDFVVPSLYRHFGHRPAFLAHLAAILLPRFADGTIAHGVTGLRTEMDRAADELVAGMSAPPAPDARIALAFTRFRTTIPQMITVGAMLERALPGV